MWLRMLLLEKYEQKNFRDILNDQLVFMKRRRRDLTQQSNKLVIIKLNTFMAV